MDPSSNEKKWKYFLSSIHSNTFKKLPTNKLTFETESKVSIKCLATTFADKLREKNGIDSKNQPETPITNANMPLGEAEDEKIDNNNEPAGEGAQPEPDTLTPSEKKKNDKDISCSMWDISKIAEYFNFDCVTELKMTTGSSHCLGDIYEMVQKDICRLSKVVRGIDLEGIKLDSYSEFLKQLISITSIETGSRLVLDALLVSLCSALDLKFEVEKKINCNFLPHCVYDYCIRKGEHIIGCIEAKSVKTLSEKSIAQAILQLIVLQTTLLRTETSKVNISEFPVFAIVTDGHRFIYMQLKGSSLEFEHDGDKLKIREVKQECDFKEILQHISFLVDSSVG